MACALGSRNSGEFPFVIARCAKRAVAIQLDCFVAKLPAMTWPGYFIAKVVVTVAMMVFSTELVSLLPSQLVDEE